MRPAISRVDRLHACGGTLSRPYAIGLPPLLAHDRKIWGQENSEFSCHLPDTNPPVLSPSPRGRRLCREDSLRTQSRPVVDVGCPTAMEVASTKSGVAITKSNDRRTFTCIFALLLSRRRYSYSSSMPHANRVGARVPFH